MTKLRFWIAASLMWLLLFFNIERFHEPINIASFVYVYAALVAIAVVAVEQLKRVPIHLAASGSLAVLLALKWLFGYEIVGPALVLTVTESCAVLVTLLLSRQIAVSIEAFERGARDVLAMHFGPQTDSLYAAQETLYREVRRARQFERPLAMLAVSARNGENSETVARFLEEIQRRGVRRYIEARLAELLNDRTKDCDVVAVSDNRFFVLLPEATKNVVAGVAERIKEAAQRELGLQVDVGMATFPDEEVTLSGLLQRSEQTLHDEDAVATIPLVASAVS